MKKNVIIATGLGLAFAAGGLFAPLQTATAGHLNAVVESTLKGKNEVANPPSGNEANVGDPNGRGEFYVFGIDGDATTLCYVLTVDKIAPATAAHIHKGALGVNGPIIANLGAPADGNSADCLTQGEVGPGTTPKFPTGETVAAILANPENYYVNVHNADYPGGALRGQLEPQG